MRRLTVRRQMVTVMTVSTLRNYLKSVSSQGCEFTIGKVDSHHLSIRADYTSGGTTKHAHVVLPAYATGFPDDATSHNLNVVLDPLSFANLASSAEREVFLPLLGRETLEHYEHMHPNADLPVSRCC